MPVVIPESMFADGAGAEGRALRFSGKESVKMRLRTYPVGASTVEFLIRPEGKREEAQGVITRFGWSDAVNIYLLPDGRIEAVRDGSEEFKTEKAVSRVPLPGGRIGRKRSLFLNSGSCGSPGANAAPNTVNASSIPVKLPERLSPFPRYQVQLP